MLDIFLDSAQSGYVEYRPKILRSGANFGKDPKMTHFGSWKSPPGTVKNMADIDVDLSMKNLQNGQKLGVE